ncbi:hypothetical protein AB0391_06850 [Streptomyces albidoflavus]|uniref:hypothetical protein n=1 Tax=Streptomyces albidoflavus TaxID=1886 RepID=UPI000B1D4AA2|nr:hypothetical protein [Streptomyces albidoflavus]
MVLGGPGGGGLANNVVGDTYVEVSGGIITTQAGSTAGGSVFGGGYARNQNVTGNTHVRIVDGADIRGGVYGGGYAGPASIQGNVVTGNADTLIEGGKIGTNIYAGAAELSRVNGTATVTLKDIAPGDPFATDFTRQILRGGIGTGGTAHTVFDHQTAPSSAPSARPTTARWTRSGSSTTRGWTWTRPASTAGTGSSRTARRSTWSPPAR